MNPINVTNPENGGLENSRTYGEEGFVTATVYRDEPIPGAAARAAAPFPSQYRAMRKLALGGTGYRESDAKLFYEQGRFMEDFEDDFEFRGDFLKYFPTYQSMNDRQLRGYFSWRTKVRHGVVEETSLSFFFILVYELLHGIGASTPEEGFHALKNLWTTYGKIDPRIDRYLESWLKDYVVYHHLDRSLLEGLPGESIDPAALTLSDCRSRDPDEVFSALNSFSPYDLEKSGFFKRYSDDVKAVVHGVFSGLSNERDGAVFGKTYSSAYTMFKCAVFHHQAAPEDFVYEINDLCRYRCENGKWTCEWFYCFKGKIREIGELLKTVDSLMRGRYGFKPALRDDGTSEAYRGIIEEEIEKLLEAKRKNALPRIDIDISKLHGIRKTALETQNKLIVEEPENTEYFDEKTGSDGTADLDDTEILFLRRLLDEKPYADLVRSRGVMASVLIDAINEKLFDAFNDTVIEFAGDEPRIVDDYRDQLEGVVGK